MKTAPLGRYRHVDRLSHGGMGEISCAYTEADRVVAIEFLPLTLSGRQIPLTVTGFPKILMQLVALRRR